MTPNLEKQLEQVRESKNVARVEVVEDLGSRLVALVVPREVDFDDASEDWGGLPAEPFLLNFSDRGLQ